LQAADCIILTTDHSCFRYDWMARHASLIIDTRNAFGQIPLPSVHRLGTPPPAPAEAVGTWQAS
jgi:UDP-N-acetyl-D-glucosamine dehydrogenase